MIKQDYYKPLLTRKKVREAIIDSLQNNRGEWTREIGSRVLVNETRGWVIESFLIYVRVRRPNLRTLRFFSTGIFEALEETWLH